MQNLILTPISLEQLTQVIAQAVKSELANIRPPEPVTAEYITRKQAAKILGVSLPTLHEWTKHGIVPGYRIGSRVRYKQDEVLQSLSQIQSSKFAKRK